MSSDNTLANSATLKHFVDDTRHVARILHGGGTESASMHFFLNKIDNVFLSSPSIKTSAPRGAGAVFFGIFEAHRQALRSNKASFLN